MTRLIKNKILYIGASLVALFFVLKWTFSPADLIILLNSLFVGSMVSIAVAYHELVWQAIRGDGIYDRIRQMTLGFALCWLAIILGVITSIYVKIADIPNPPYTTVAMARYVAIIAAMLQVTAPDFGLGLFHGRDRKVMTASIGFGLITAFVLIMAQSDA